MGGGISASTIKVGAGAAAVLFTAGVGAGAVVDASGDEPASALTPGRITGAEGLKTIGGAAAMAATFGGMGSLAGPKLAGPLAGAALVGSLAYGAGYNLVT